MARRGAETDKAATAATLREARLKAALKANMARRKGQAKLREAARASPHAEQQTPPVPDTDCDTTG